MKTCTDTLMHPLTSFTKHVYFAEGMVLGEDDFTQEFAYLSGHQHLLSRGALGYGTLCGLQVKYESTEVKVTPGLALTPTGELVRVPRLQCASLSTWLKKQSGVKDGEQHLYVTLEYRSCPTDEEPLPSQPCRTAQESLVPSRWEDDFILDFSFTQPDHRLYRLEHEFSAWLREKVRARNLQEEELPQGTVQQLVAVLQQNLKPDLGSGIEAYLQGILTSLLDGEGHLSVPEVVLDEVFQALTTYWVTTLRPAALDAEATPDGMPPRQHALLLAELVVDYQAGTVNSVQINEGSRPVLLDLGMLTAYLQQGEDRLLYGEVTGPTHNTKVSKIQTYDVYPDAEVREKDEPLTFLGLKDNVWQASPFPELVGDVTGNIKSTFLSAIQGVPVDHAASESNQLLVTTYLGSAESEEDPLRLVWVPRSAPTGDVVLDFENGNAMVVGLQGHHVSDQTPDYNQILKYTGSEWVPVYLGGDVTGDPQNSQLSAIQGVKVWGPAAQGNQILLTQYQEGETLYWTPVNLPHGDIQLDFAQEKATVTGLRGTPLRDQAPDNSQILVFTGEDWAPVNIAGDVIGDPQSTFIRALQGIEVQGTPTKSDQTLVSVSLGSNEGFVWQVRDLPAGGEASDLKGDVQGNPQQTSVKNLQGVPLDAKPSRLGQVLMSVESATGMAWAAHDLPRSSKGDFVRTVPDQPYGLYAAGVIYPQNFNPQDLYNIKGFEPMGYGRMMVYFGPYQHDGGPFQYVVKVSTQSREPQFSHIQVIEPVNPEGVMLQLFGSQGGEIVPVDTQRFGYDFAIHLEVNYYPVNAR
ncbi:hypothetical protein [Deinococcus cellulosilyticus]|uniref:Uncharacterized protein n=1 Tax=Deinococcus cellulosilyticus (strain DSM 18568 / NBRC 106333 / KACC 11606 / 5516J-15) TaxID=1223518 RepID=A0A511MZP5_DEIC1|nr:hypothetical protein [Deinococcus cellulosilyticus]GEM46022.1 hypothetical protein DC3_16570 [Deinococcus cellulosilyticus NBRC 106333 = KACC 11606]